MMKVIFNILMILISGSYYVLGQTTEPNTNDFSAKWNADSSGTDGYRENHCSMSKQKKNCLVNGIYLFGYSKDKVITLLGKPSDIATGGKDGLLNMYYIINKNFLGHTVKVLVIQFNENNNVAKINIGFSNQRK